MTFRKYDIYVGIPQQIIKNTIKENFKCRSQSFLINIAEKCLHIRCPCDLLFKEYNLKSKIKTHY